MKKNETSNVLPVPANLSKLGFKIADDEIPLRLLVSSQGLDKTGKTEFWMGAPGPIAGVNLDIGTEGVIHKHSKKKSIWVMSMNVPFDPHNINAAFYKPHWQKLEKAYIGALEHPDVRTVVVDTATDMWELMRLAEFGDTTPKSRGGALDYKTANALYRSLIRKAYETDKNLILTHKVGQQWTTKRVDGQDKRGWDGVTYERLGFHESDYLIQVNISHFYRGGKFGINIINCRHDMGLAGYEMEQEESTFAHLGALVHGNNVGDWK